jgi:hypothetical protein
VVWLSLANADLVGFSYAAECTEVFDSPQGKRKSRKAETAQAAISFDFRADFRQAGSKPASPLLTADRLSGPPEDTIR